MRTDMKVGLVCGILVAGGLIAYINWPSSAPKAASSSITDLQPADNHASGSSVAAAGTSHGNILGPAAASAATADQPTAAAPGAPYPASFGTSAAGSSSSAGASSPSSGNTLVLEPGSTVPHPSVADGGSPTTQPTPTAGLTAAGAPAGDPLSTGAPIGTGRPTLQLESATSIATTTYTIKAGDNFSKIAKATYGNIKPSTLNAIQQANPTVDSRRLQIGEKLTLPALPSTAAAITPTTPGPIADPIGTGTHTTHPTATGTPTPTGTATTYTVKKGDDLHKIAKIVYGDDRRWKQIARTNRDILSDPNSLTVGMVLKLPPV